MLRCYCNPCARDKLYAHANSEPFSGDYDKCSNPLISSQSLWLQKCAIKCINKHRNRAKMKLMLQTFSLMFSTHHYADGVELQPLHQSQSWNLLKVQLLVPSPQIQNSELCTPFFMLVSPAGRHIFLGCINNDKCFQDWMLLSLNQRIPSLRAALPQKQICPATNIQSSTWIFYSISVTNFIFNSPSVNANYTVK